MSFGFRHRYDPAWDNPHGYRLEADPVVWPVETAGPMVGETDPRWCKFCLYLAVVEGSCDHCGKAKAA